MGGTIGYLVFFLSTLRVFRALLPLLWCPSWTLLGSLFFFDRVHLTSLTFHTFVLMHCSCSLHSWTLSKGDIFVDPKNLEA